MQGYYVDLYLPLFASPGIAKSQPGDRRDQRNSPVVRGGLGLYLQSSPSYMDSPLSPSPSSLFCLRHPGQQRQPT